MGLFTKRSAAQDVFADDVYRSKESPSALLKRIRLSTSNKLDSLFAGAYRSAFKGSGLSFDSVREYQYGDDVRAVDWNVSARMNHLYIKEYIEERDISILLMLDVSASTAFGGLRSKRDVMLEITDLILQLARLNRDRVSALLFSDKIEKIIKPENGSRFAMRVLDEIIKHKPASTKTDIGAAVDFASRILKKRSVVFCISDFLDEKQDYANKLKILARRHEVISVQIFDPYERKTPFLGLTNFLDLETGDSFLADVIPEITSFPEPPAGSSVKLSTLDKIDSVFLEFLERRAGITARSR